MSVVSILCATIFIHSEYSSCDLSRLAGPGLINLGRALAGGANASQIAIWLAALVGGGLLA